MSRPHVKATTDVAFDACQTAGYAGLMKKVKF
jgi:hypothetical protein